MIFGQSFDVVLKGIDPCCCQDPSLPHPASELLAKAMSLGDTLRRADDQGTHGGPQSLRKAQRARVKILGVILGRQSCGHTGVHESCPVEVQWHADGTSEFANGADILQWPDTTTAAIVGVFQADKGGRGMMHIGGAYHWSDLLDVHDAMLTIDQIDLHASQRR